jgi:hypothetical protein
MAPASPIAGASAWVWKPAAWRDRSEQLLGSARRLGLSRLYVTIEIGDGAVRHARALADFVATAEAHAITIEAVEGDPRMTEERGLAFAMGRASTLRSALLLPDRRHLAGVQYDVEPYVRRGWRGDAVDYGRWGQAIARLADALGERVDLVVLFWLLNRPEGAAMLHRLRDAMRLVTVMAYQTAEPALFDIVRSWTRWSSGTGIPLQVAVETGPGDPITSFQGDIHRASAALAAVLARLPAAPPVGLAVHGLRM